MHLYPSKTVLHHQCKHSISHWRGSCINLHCAETSRRTHLAQFKYFVKPQGFGIWKCLRYKHKSMNRRWRSSFRFERFRQEYPFLKEKYQYDHWLAFAHIRNDRCNNNSAVQLKYRSTGTIRAVVVEEFPLQRIRVTQYHGIWYDCN